MNVIIKRLALIALLLALPLSAWSVDGFSVLSIENGYAPGYNIGSGNWNVASRFALSIQMTDKLAAGFTFIDGDGTIIPDYRFLRLSYGFSDRLAMAMLLGSNGAIPVSGLGFDLIAFQRRYQDAFTTQFKVDLDYIFQPTLANGLTSGTLLMSLVFSIGI
jgi:hypothetical protein